MRICVILAKRPLRWQLLLADLLRQGGRNEVVVCRSSTEPARPPALGLLIALEALVYRRGGEELLEILPAMEIPSLEQAPPVGPFDLAISLSGNVRDGPPAPRTLAPHFDNHATEVGAIGALLDGRAFSIGVMERGPSGVRRADYIAALDDRLLLSRSLANVCSRVAELLVVHAFRTCAPRPSEALVDTSDDAAPPSSALLGWHVMSNIQSKLLEHLTALAKGGRRWAVGWRDLAGDTPIIGGQPKTARYRVLKDDGRRYFADPFLISQHGKTYLFCEEYPFATGKGIISVFTRGEDGAFSGKQTALERPHHLSYPFVFKDAGQVWMIPESGASGKVDLYRAAELPHRWVHEATLIAGIRAFDATLHRDENGYWLLLTTAHWHSSSSDRLSLYHAQSLTGPWQCCDTDPILIDPSTARCAGRLFKSGGALLRPVQDCTRMYGDALRISRVTTLGSKGFSERPAGRLSTVDRHNLIGPHTYDRDDNTEVIDIFGCVSGRSAVDIRYDPYAPPSAEATAHLAAQACIV